MTTVTILYRSDAWHNNKEMLGVFTTKGNAINAAQQLALDEDEDLSIDDIYNLNNINQTQGYSGFGEFVVEEIEINKIIS